VIYSAWPQAVDTLMNDLAWFQTQLEASSAGFAWAVAQIPAGREDREPPAPLGVWSAARHVFHMLFYEREVALPNWGLWLGRSLNLEAVVPAGVATLSGVASAVLNATLPVYLSVTSRSALGCFASLLR